MEVLVLLIVFGTVSFIAYLYFSARHKERMALLEYSKDATVFASRRRPDRPGTGALKFGLLLVFAGAGLISAYVLSELIGIPEELAVFSMLFLGAGLGLLVFYRINPNQRHLHDVEEEERVHAEVV